MNLAENIYFLVGNANHSVQAITSLKATSLQRKRFQLCGNEMHDRTSNKFRNYYWAIENYFTVSLIRFATSDGY